MDEIYIAELMMRIPEKYRKCRYANISQLFYGLKTFDGDTCSFGFK